MMNTNTNLFHRSLSLILLLGLLSAHGCATKLERLRNSEPISNHQELQSRLNLREEGRAKAIIVGEQGKANLINTFSGDATRTGYTCAFDICWCEGDVDCNNMFSTICRDPSTNGSCGGSPTVCSCTPN